MGNQCLECFFIGYGLDAAELQFGRYFFDLGQTHHFKRPDVAPSDVKFVGFDRELGRRRIGVVIVVQFFTADHHAPRRNVGTGIRCLKVAVTPIVANAIDDASCCDGNPDHLNRPDRQASGAKQRQIDDHHQANTLPAESGVEVALNPVVGCGMPILREGFLVFAFGAVQLGALPEDFLDAVRLRTVRVVYGFAFCVVLAVDGHPFLGDLACSKPQPKAEKMRRNRVQIHGSMGLVAVQINGHAGDGDVGRHQRIQNNLPPTRSQQSMRQPFQCGIKQDHKNPLSISSIHKQVS